MAFDLKYLGHSAFEIKTPERSILIDPFLQVSNYDYRNENITDIFLTHGHADHLGSAIDTQRPTMISNTATATPVENVHCQLFADILHTAHIARIGALINT